MLTIIMDIQNEDDRSFVEDLYARFERQMYVISYNVLKNHHDSQDCVHEVVARMIEHLESLREAKENGALASYILISCRNCANSMYRKKQLMKKFEVNDETYDDNEEDSIAERINNIPDDSMPIDKIIISEENVRLIKDMIDSLDPKYRDVVVLKGMGLRYEEIADAMGISVSLARQRMKRARKKLIEMGGEHFDYKK